MAACQPLKGLNRKTQREVEGERWGSGTSVWGNYLYNGAGRLRGHLSTQVTPSASSRFAPALYITSIITNFYDDSNYSTTAWLLVCKQSQTWNSLQSHMGQFSTYTCSHLFASHSPPRVLYDRKGIEKISLHYTTHPSLWTEVRP